MRRKYVGWTMAGLLALAGVVSPSWGQAGESPAAEAATNPSSGPTAKEIIERFIEATGGRARYEKMTNRVQEGTMEIPMQGLKGKTSMTQAAPNKMLMTMDLGGFGSQKTGTDGQVAWSVDTMQGARLLEGEEKEAMARQATFNSELNWESLYKEVKAIGVQEIDGRKAHAVMMIAPDGQELTNFYDKESGLLIKTSTVAKTPMGEIPMESTYSDYRDVDGLKFAHKTVISSAMGMQILMTIDRIQVNADLPPDTFAPPEEVKALIGASGANGGSEPSKKQE